MKKKSVQRPVRQKWGLPNNDRIAIAVVARDRFSMFPRCLETLYDHTSENVSVIAIADQVDDETKTYLERFQTLHANFTAVFVDEPLNQAEIRKLALDRVSERFCVILENDTLVHENWLPPLIECLLDEKAAVVMPLIYWYRGLHAAGGAFVERREMGSRKFDHCILYSDIRRKRIDYPESHCILIDRQVMPGGALFDDVEPFDVDLGLTMRKHNLKVYFEPASLVTYSAPPNIEMRDVRLFKRRWNPAAWRARNVAFNRKWDVEYSSAVRKMASYRRQQLKLGPARWWSNRLTLSVSNAIMRATNYLQSSSLHSSLSSLISNRL